MTTGVEPTPLATAAPASTGPPEGARRGRLRVPIAWVLVVGFGGLVLAAATSVLLVSATSNYRNTFALLEGSAVLRLDTIETHIRDQLAPVETLGRVLAERIVAGTLAPENPVQLRDMLLGALGALPQLTGISYTTPEGRSTAVGYWFGRDEEAYAVDRSGDSLMRPHLEIVRTAKTPVWSDLVWIDELGQSMLVLHVPVRDETGFIGGIGLLVSTATISDFVEQLSYEDIDAPAFVLYGRDHVLAHRNIRHNPWAPDGDYRNLTGRAPLPTRADLHDPILDMIGREHIDQVLNRAGESHAVTLPEESRPEHLVLGRRLDGFGPVPWIIGQQYRVEDLEPVIDRLFGSILVGIVILLVAVAVAFVVGHRIARKISRLAAVAEKLRALEFADVPDLPDSHLRELANAGRAFNAMLTAMRWFEMYVPKSLVLRLMRGGSIITSQERGVTVMFTDIRGFTPLSQQMGAADVADLLNEHFSLLSRCIEAEGGTVDKFIGDSVMAFWGAPEDQPDHPMRALRTAQAIQRGLAADNRRREAAGLPPIKVRIGINSGPAIVGNIGSASRINYTLIGDTVNTAARLEFLAKSFHKEEDVIVLISEATAKGLPDIDLTPLGEHGLRGRAGSITVYRLPDAD